MGKYMIEFAIACLLVLIVSEIENENKYDIWARDLY